MIYSGDTKDLSALLSRNLSPAIKNLWLTTVISKYNLGLKTNTDFVGNDEIVARFSDMEISKITKYVCSKTIKLFLDNASENINDFKLQNLVTKLALVDELYA